MSASSQERGGATVELALVLPVFVSLLVFGGFLTELARAKLKAQEASRYAAWQMTARPLEEEGVDAARAVAAEAEERYADLDSVEPRAGARLGVVRAPVAVQIETRPVTGWQLEAPVSTAGGAGEEASRVHGRPLRELLEGWGFSTDGEIQVEVSTEASAGVRAGGLERLAPLTFRSRAILVVDDWHLREGEEVIAQGKRAGVHRDGRRSALHRKVARLSFLHAPSYLDVSGLDALQQLLPLHMPDLSGAFVVSKSYTAGGGGADCNRPGHGAPGGLNDVAAYPGLDDPLQRCFDTAPFRDTTAYADSRYRQLFMARGPYFMGCKNAQADVPSAPGLLQLGDLQTRKVACE